jgi:hypothetical protein
VNSAVDVWFYKPFLEALAHTLSIVVPVWLAYVFGLRHMRKQTQVQVRQDLRQRQANALEAAWSLLQCLTQTENGNNFLHFEQRQRTAESPSQKLYFVHIPNAQAFVFNRLPDTFYAKGAGLHWSPSIKEKFYECRTLVYAILLAEQQAHAPAHPQLESALRPIKNTAWVHRIEKLYGELNDLLRKELLTIYNQKA